MISLKEFVLRNQVMGLQRSLVQEIAARRQRECPHMAGALGNECALYTSIVWHELDTGIVYGICFACGRHFTPGQTDYLYWRDRKSLNIRSQAHIGRVTPITQREYEEGSRDQFCPLDECRSCHPLSPYEEYMW